MALEAQEIKEKLAALRKELYKKKKKLEQIEQAKNHSKQLKTQKEEETKLVDRSSDVESKVIDQSKSNNKIHEKSSMKFDFLQQNKLTSGENGLVFNSIKNRKIGKPEISEVNQKYSDSSRNFKSSSDQIHQHTEFYNKTSNPQNEFISKNVTLNDSLLGNSNVKISENCILDPRDDDHQNKITFRVPTVLLKKKTNNAAKESPVFRDSLSKKDITINNEQHLPNSETRVSPSPGNLLDKAELSVKKATENKNSPFGDSSHVNKINTSLSLQSSLNSLTLSKSANNSIKCSLHNNVSDIRSESSETVFSSSIHHKRDIGNKKKQMLDENSFREKNIDNKTECIENLNFRDFNIHSEKQLSRLSFNKTTTTEIPVVSPLSMIQQCKPLDENKCGMQPYNHMIFQKADPMLKQCESKRIRDSDNLKEIEIEFSANIKNRSFASTEKGPDTADLFTESSFTACQHSSNMGANDNSHVTKASTCKANVSSDCDFKVPKNDEQETSVFSETSWTEFFKETSDIDYILDARFEHHDTDIVDDTKVADHPHVQKNCLQTNSQKPVVAMHFSEVLVDGQQCIFLITCLTNSIIIWKWCSSQWKVVEEKSFQESEEQYFTFLEKGHWIVIFILKLLENCIDLLIFRYGTKITTSKFNLNFPYKTSSSELKHSLLFCCLNNQYIVLTSTALISPLWVLMLDTGIDIPNFGLTFELPSVQDNLLNLLPIDNLDYGVLGYSSSSFYIWNVEVKQLVRVISRKPSNLFGSFLWASSESGRLYLLQKPALHSVCALIVLNPVTGQSTSLQEFHYLKPFQLNQNLMGSVDMPYFMITSKNSIHLWNILSSQMIAQFQSPVKILSSSLKLCSANQRKFQLLAVGLQNNCIHIFSVVK